MLFVNFFQPPGAQKKGCPGDGHPFKAVFLFADILLNFWSGGNCPAGAGIFNGSVTLKLLGEFLPGKKDTAFDSSYL